MLAKRNFGSLPIQSVTSKEWCTGQSESSLGAQCQKGDYLIFWLKYLQKPMILTHQSGVVKEEYLVIILGSFSPVLHKNILLWVFIRSTSAIHILMNTENCPRIIAKYSPSTSFLLIPRYFLWKHLRCASQKDLYGDIYKLLLLFKNIHNKH